MLSSYRQPLIFAVVIWGISLLLAWPVYATNYSVSKTADSNDGTCDADCSLREAITAANADPADDTITFDLNGTFTLASTLPIIFNNGTLTITGNGVANTIMSGNNAVQLFSVLSGATLTLNSLALTHGNGVSQGGAITNSGNLNLSHCDISNNNSSSSGGGIHNTSATGLNIDQCTFSGNASGYGGAIYSDNGLVTVTNSDFTDNTATVQGGAMWIFRTSGTGLNMTDSRIMSNTATNNGGGIYAVDAAVTLTNTILDSNSITNGWGGGMRVTGALTMKQCRVTNNTAFPGDGGGMVIGATATIDNSTLSNNHSSIGGGSSFVLDTNNDANSVTLRNTLVSGNTCRTTGHGTINAINSLIETGLTTCVFGTNSNNLTGDPALNSDYTLSAVSIAINSGNNSLIPNGTTTDLAGNSRIQQSTVDIGAYESPFSPPLSTITISATDDNGAESGPDPVTFQITRSAPTIANLIVHYTIGGTASSTDYTPTLTGSATIAANSTSVNITLTPVADNLAESNETVTLTLSANAAYTLGTTTSASATIANKGNAIFQDDFEN